MLKTFLFGTVILIISSCTPYEDIQFRGIDDFKFGKLDGKKLSFSFDATLNNPNGYGLKIKPSVLDVYLGDTYMGVIHLDHKVKIKRKSETEVEVPLTAELGEGALLKLILMSKKGSLTIRLKGTVKGSVWGFSRKEYIDETREINLKNIDLDFLNFLK